jgi:hypothetical protein
MVRAIFFHILRAFVSAFGAAQFKWLQRIFCCRVFGAAFFATTCAPSAFLFYKSVPAVVPAYLWNQQPVYGFQIRSLLTGIPFYIFSQSYYQND